jgi:very-short-patch-repair endonuclease
MAELATRQHGVVARRQLLGLGMGRRHVDERVRRGRLHLLHRGVYAVGHRVLGRDGHWMAAVLAAGPEAVLSHRSAGVLWRLIPSWSGPVEVTTSRKSRPRAGIHVHYVILPGDEATVVAGIPVTSPFRTLLDLAAVLRRRELERAFNELKVRRLTDVMPLAELLARHPGRRGSVDLRTLLVSKAPEGRTRNDFEEDFVALLDANGLPRPRLNADLALRGRFFEIDCLWELQRVAVELDSRMVHGTDKGFESDRQRDRILLAEGWRTARVTWLQLRDEPESIVADLRGMLQGSPG